MRKLSALLLTLLCLAGAGHAHFDVSDQNRIVILDRETGRLYLRIPAPLAFSRELATRTSPTDRVEASFVAPEAVGGRWAHRLDTAEVAAEPERFMDKVAGGYEVRSGDETVSPGPFAVAIHPRSDLPPFATPADARTSLERSTADMPFVGEAVVDIGMDLGPLAETVSLESVLPEISLPPDVFIDNHVLDWQGGGVQRQNVTGQLIQPVVMQRDLPATIGRYVMEGVRHILEGPDHVLFVVCLTLAAASVGQLLWAVTGFTIGHSATLIAGFLGLTPAVAWFVPAVEAAIAASIIYAGAMALLRRGVPSIWIIAVLGLLHGFGFSFVLGDVLGRQSPDLVLSLLSFNVGVEVGQVAIVAVVLWAMWALRELSGALATGARIAGASLSIGVAAIWLIERVELVAGVL